MIPKNLRAKLISWPNKIITKSAAIDGTLDVRKRAPFSINSPHKEKPETPRAYEPSLTIKKHITFQTIKPEEQQSLLIITFQHPKSPNNYKAKRNYSKQIKLC